MENTEAKNDTFLLNGLVADIALERAKLAQMTGQLSLLNDRIKADIKGLQEDFKVSQISIEEQLTESLRLASEEFAEKSFTIFKDKAFSKSQEAITKLEHLSNKTYSNMCDLTKAYTMGFKKLIFIMSIGGLLSGTIGAIGYGFFFNKFFQVSPGTKQHLAWGIALENFWPDLTDREQDKLNKLLKDNAP